MKSVFLIIITIIFGAFPSTNLFAQDLMNERIRKLSSNKTSVYIDKGVFHNGGVKNVAVLRSMRQSFNAKLGYERIVFDFTTNQIPKVYGHLSSLDKKIHIDLFDTTLAKDFQTTGNKRAVEKINFFPIENNYLSMEMSLKGKATADIFYLENPGRLVIDLKN